MVLRSGDDMGGPSSSLTQGETGNDEESSQANRAGSAKRSVFNLVLPKMDSFALPNIPFSAPSRSVDGHDVAFRQTVTPPRSMPQTPWHNLAATSGAPTPSIESGPSMRGNSPHLGYPFERLNIGGSWSGANLFGDNTVPVPTSGLPSPKDAPPSGTLSPGTPSGPVGGMSLETLKRYRSQAGKAPLGQEEPEFKLNLPTALQARRNPPLSKVDVPSSTNEDTKPMPSPSSLKPKSRLQPLSSTNLKPMIDKTNTLILDIRPPSSFQPSHVKSSHSLPIPSTLLRRPAFTLPKLVQMLPQPSMDEVANWKGKTDIVLVDQDSGTAPDGSVLKGLASKFEREGFRGNLWFVTGGYSSILSSGCELEGTDDAPEIGPADEKGLRAGRLGRLAFEHESTGGRSAQPPALAVATPGFTFSNNPYDIKLPTLGNASPSISRSSGTSNRSAKLQPANPFFDNIRQNLELSHGGITERIPLNLPSETKSRAEEMPAWLAQLVQMDEKDSTEKLAQQFYEIELGEQKRLQSVMEWHSRGSGGILDDDAGRGGRTGNMRAEQRKKDSQEVDRLVAWGEGFESVGEDYFPFSITAGVERGTKNRYKNIWPYDFSRVRLSSPSDDDSDYINASFVQPRGTYRRYIATQGPLDATYRDFWTLVWEQDVRVIVMLTKQYEGGLLKCGNYWGDQVYGSMRLQLISQTGGEDAVDSGGTTGFHFGSHTKSDTAPSSDVENIKRVFLLRHDGRPMDPPRKIVQIQCVTWPDFDVPQSPDILLNLIKDVDSAMDEIPSKANMRDSRDDRQSKPPVLVHCSAGVGRTGSFIIVDAVLDGLRRDKTAAEERQAKADELARSSVKAPSSPRPRAPSIVTSGSSESRSSNDSTKSVSFVETSTPLSSVIEDEPLTQQTPMPSTSNAAAQDYMQAKDNIQDHKMELDSPLEAKSSAGFRFGFGSDDQVEQSEMRIKDDSNFSEWREDRRPSLASVYSSERTSFERLPSEAIHRDIADPRSVTKSDVPARSPSPLSTLQDPIAAVLEGMRVQRMSLVQSLRQYLFVHRAIIHHYLSMMDDEANGDVDESSPSPSPSQSALSDTENSSFASRTGTGATSTSELSHAGDEDMHVKRRASPTELQMIEDETVAAEDPNWGASGLSKRPSFKKMRATEGKSPAEAASGTSMRPASPGAPGSSPVRSNLKK